MRTTYLFVLFLILGMSSSASAQELRDCGFGFDIDTQSSAFQSLVVDGEEKRGFWLSINRAPTDVRSLAKHIGRLQVCLMTPDGKPRSVRRAGRTIKLESPFLVNCTAALLPGNRLLTNAHCFYDPDLKRAGFNIVREARINFDYTSRDDTGSVKTYLVATRELTVNEGLDALVLQVLGGDANADLGGHIPMKMMSAVEPFQELRMVHHPGANPQQYSTGTCQVHRRQSEVPDTRSPFRHTCESMGGSSGSLLFDSRTLSVVALHNQGGLQPTGDSFNGGHKIGKIEAALNLGFEEFAPRDNISDTAQRALTDALLQFDPGLKAQALRNLISSFPGSPQAKDATRALEQLTKVNDAALQLAAGQALSDALLKIDPEAQLDALRQVVLDYSGSQAAQKAQSAITRLETNLASQEQNIKTATKLTEAPANADTATMGALLEEHKGTPIKSQNQDTLQSETESKNSPDTSLIQQCDMLTAHESNYDNPFGVDTVNFDSIVPDLAIPACEAALEAFPENLRMRYQLGRAFLAGAKYDQNFSLWSQAADAGYAEAQFGLGLMYKLGVGVVGQDLEAALQLYKQAAEQGHSGAQNNLGLMYRNGDGVAKDLQAAAHWYRIAAALGNKEAQNNLESLMQDDAFSALNQGQSENGSLEFKDCDGNNLTGCNAAGLHYFNRSWETTDQTIATHFFLKACDAGDAEGCYNAGQQFHNGRGAEADNGRTVQLFMKACDGGHADACYLAGRKHFIGDGVEENKLRATRLFAEACEYNSSAGCNGAAYNYLHGYGVEIDVARSKKYYAKSCSLGDETVCEFQ